jgi:hypothetical protein
MKIRRCLFGTLLLSALASGAGWAAPTGAGSAGNGRQAADSAGGNQGAQRGHGQGDHSAPTAAKQHQGATASSEAQNGASRASRKARDHTGAPAPSAGAKALATAAMTPNRHFAAVPRLGTNTMIPNTVPAVAANAAPRHTLVKASVGGPAMSDAKHGTLIAIGGTAMSRGPKFRPGDQR